MRRIIWLSALLTLSVAVADAGPLTDAVMMPGVFARAEPGVLLRYVQDRAMPQGASEAARSGPLSEAKVWLEASPGEHGPVISLVREADGVVRPIAAFPGGGANPVLLYFLEGVVHVMAEATGGSPFYIRNRLRDALGSAPAGTLSDGIVTATIEPFAADPNRERMGAFAGLRLMLTYPDGQPARLLSLSADTQEAGRGYHDHMRLTEN